jgi:hypothetical protein
VTSATAATLTSTAWKVSSPRASGTVATARRLATEPTPVATRVEDVRGA